MGMLMMAFGIPRAAPSMVPGGSFGDPLPPLTAANLQNPRLRASMVSPASSYGSARGTMRPVREDVGAATPHPALLAVARRVLRGGNLQRDDAEESIFASTETGMPLPHPASVLAAAVRGCLRLPAASARAPFGSSSAPSKPLGADSAPYGTWAKGEPVGLSKNAPRGGRLVGPARMCGAG